MNIVFDQKVPSDLTAAIGHEYKVRVYRMSNVIEDGKTYTASRKGSYALVLAFDDVEAFIQYAYMTANGEYERAATIAQRHNALLDESEVQLKTFKRTPNGLMLSGERSLI